MDKNSGVIIEIREVPYKTWEFLEDCDNLDQAYNRLDELEDHAVKMGWPSDVNNYRIGWSNKHVYIK